jgi:hypothetical protein
MRHVEIISQSGSIETQLDIAISQLAEGDKVKLLQFAEALIEQKQGKRAKRAARFRDDMDEGFRFYG